MSHVGNSALLRQWDHNQNTDEILYNIDFGISITGTHEILVNLNLGHIPKLYPHVYTNVP